MNLLHSLLRSGDMDGSSGKREYVYKVILVDKTSSLYTEHRKGRDILANQEHLAILKQGVDVWNKWRDEHRDMLPDLSYINLNRIYLRRAHLTGAYL